METLIHGSGVPTCCFISLFPSLYNSIFHRLETTFVNKPGVLYTEGIILGPLTQQIGSRNRIQRSEKDVGDSICRPETDNSETNWNRFTRDENSSMAEARIELELQNEKGALRRFKVVRSVFDNSFVLNDLHRSACFVFWRSNL